MSSINGKTALVTGGSRGIGRAIALRLAESGARVAINYVRNDAAANETVKRFLESGTVGEDRKGRNKRRTG